MFDTVAARLGNVLDTPFRNLRFSLWWIRKTFFARPRSDVPAFRVPLGPGEVKELLGRHNFEPGWNTSYYYYDEVLNLRRPEYHDHETGYEWWQVHVRGYDHPEGVELEAHFETDPSEHPDAHVDLVGLDVERGLRALGSVLAEHDVDYRRVEPDAEVVEPAV